MGLDMYLDRMPRFENVTPKEVMAISSYFEWKQSKEEGNKYANCTLKEWCGVEYKDISKRAIKFYKPFHTTKYSSWDTEHKFGYSSISEQVAYWRKANHIHKWFVENVQGGDDNCEYYEVSKEQLEDLIDVCNIVKEKCVLKKGQVKNGERMEDGKWVPIYEEGEFIENPEVAKEYLPTTDGFFFGGTEYDQWYMEDIEYTIEALTKVLKETDFETHMIAYCSSW